MGGRKCVCAVVLCFLSASLPFRAAAGVAADSAGQAPHAIRKPWSDVLFNVKVKPYVPKKKKNGKEGGGFLSHTFGGHVDRTFEKAFDYSIVLVPSYSREGSVGIGGMGAALFRLDRKDSLMPPSDVSLSGNASLRGFFYAGILGNMYFPGRKSRLNYEISFSQRVLNFWGINYDSCFARPAIFYTRWNVRSISLIIRRSG